MKRSDGGRCELCAHWDHYCPATRDGAKPCRAGAPVRTAESSCPDRFEPVGALSPPGLRARRQLLIDAEERALADLRDQGCLLRDFGGWWLTPAGPPHQHRGPHDAKTIRRLVGRKAVVVVGDRCLLYPELRGDRDG